MLSLQITNSFSSGKVDRKGEEDHNDYPEDLGVVLKCNCALSLIYPFAAKFEQRYQARTTSH